MGDLEQRGLLDSTVVVWMGEFGRTPVINSRQGRDHYPNAWSVVLGGGGIKGGAVIGKTSKDGLAVEDRPVSVPDLLATLCQALGIDHERQNMSNVGRPIRIVEPGRARREGGAGMRTAAAALVFLLPLPLWGEGLGVKGALLSCLPFRALPVKNADRQARQQTTPGAAPLVLIDRAGKPLRLQLDVRIDGQSPERAWEAFSWITCSTTSTATATGGSAPARSAECSPCRCRAAGSWR